MIKVNIFEAGWQPFRCDNPTAKFSYLRKSLPEPMESQMQPLDHGKFSSFSAAAGALMTKLSSKKPEESILETFELVNSAKKDHNENLRSLENHGEF